ncbi:hypothetical protein GCM10023219_21020 [Stakelama sediminis]|uniref:Uncharacterized protein n=1 Tax=Stakelama sediminis TaxID=463200 RepID=A0A840Z253_9SPHN|nr:glycoside hydrolase [Stakelama sediminis]MBB5719973.1 hypothetical protein [Stakelama sediminis]
MTPTLIGLILMVIGLFLLVRGSLAAMLSYTMLCGLLSGSSAINLPALGGSSIPPSQFALLFLFLRVILPGQRYLPLLLDGIKQNALLIIFVLYGIAASIAAPRIFANTINVAPMRFVDPKSLFDTVPLVPTSQNITTSVYMVGTMVIAVLGSVACRAPGGAVALVRTSVAIAWIHTITGVLGIFTRGTPADVVFEFLRNASYAQLDQSYQGFIRINGVFAEASTYASFALAWFYLNFELWWRGVMPRSTGPASFILAAVLLFSTSSTAYVGLASYAAFVGIRVLLMPVYAPLDRLAILFLSGIGMAALASIAMLAMPGMFEAMVEMIRHMTIDKSDSLSGAQRLFWAMQGWDGFIHSHGLGLGPGSFRSSSLFMAILGSTGVIGMTTFLLYLWRVLAPLRASTWTRMQDPVVSIGAASACAAIGVLVPAAISSPSPNPGTNFALFAAAALALRPRHPFLKPARPLIPYGDHQAEVHA